MRFVHRQMSPMIARALRQWGNGVSSGLIQVTTAIDILPPELQIHLANLKPDTSPNRDQQINLATPTENTQRYGFLSVSPFATSPVAFTITQILQQPKTQRIHLCIQNLDNALDMAVFFGNSAGVGLLLTPRQSIFYDEYVPQDDIYINGNGANLAGRLAYSNKEI